MEGYGHVMQPLARAIPALPSLQHFGISRVYQSNELVRLLQDLTGLRSLRLDMHRRSSDAGAALAGALREMTQLTSLCILDQLQGCDEIQGLAPAIGQLTQLQV